MPTPDQFMQSGAMPEGVSPDMVNQLMQQMGGAGNITDILAQLSQMSPEEVSSALASLGVQVDPKELQAAAESWVEGAADKASGTGAGDEAPDAAAEGVGGPASPAQPTGAAPSAPDEAEVAGDPDAEYEGMEAQAAASPDDMASAGMGAGGAGGGPSPQDIAKAQEIIARNTGGGGAMPRGVGGMPSGVGSKMDAAISASMGGDIPGGPRMRTPNIGGPRVAGPGAPTATPPATKGTNRDLITQMYRQAAAQDRGVAQTGVKRGPRTGGGK